MSKSWAVRRKLVLLALNYNNLKLLLLRRTFPELRENHLIFLREELNNFAKYNMDEKAFTFPNGSRLKLGYCEAENDVLQFQGQQYDVIALEEATHFSEWQRTNLTLSNRSVRTDFTPRMYYSCNPGGVGHAWVKRLFIDKQYENKERAEDYSFIPALVYDNKVLMETNPEYVEALENLPEDMKRAHLYGDWDVYAGQYYPEFRQHIHVIEPFEFEPHWNLYRSLDYGLDKTACYWYAINDTGQVFCYRELHESNLTLSQAAKRILDLTPVEEVERIKYTIASPDLWNRRQDKGLSGFEIMYKEGLKDLMKADNDRITGWRAIKEYLTPYQNEFGETIANIRIFKNCKHLIKNLPLLQHDAKKTEDVSTTPHDITHGPESLRYFLKSRPRLSVKPEVKPEINTHNYVYDKYIKEKNKTGSTKFV